MIITIIKILASKCVIIVIITILQIMDIMPKWPFSEVDKPRNRANCDKSMKIGESTKFDMLNKIGYRPLLKYGPLCYF